MATTSRGGAGPPRGFGETVATGITMFAGTMLATVSTFGILQGVSAIGQDEQYLTGPDYVYALNVSAWGWIHLVLGVAGTALGIAVLARQRWATAPGVAIAVLAMLANFAFLPSYPVWAVTALAANGVVIRALCTPPPDAPRRHCTNCPDKEQLYLRTIDCEVG